MKMHITIEAYVEGMPLPLVQKFTDDVDAEGTMLAKYLDPLLDDAVTRWKGKAYVEFTDNWLLVRPEKITALRYAVSEIADA